MGFRRKRVKEAMTILPIVEVTLRQAARRRWTYWSRVVAVILASLVAIPASLAVGSMRGGAFMGFVGFSPWLLLMLLSASVRSTADCISSEKRDGTLGLLFLTDLKGRDVVLGKLAGICLPRFSTWLAALPPAAILVLAGGFSWLDVLRIMLAIANVQFCGAAAGMLGSSICRKQNNALSIGSIWISFTCLVFPVAGIVVVEVWNLTKLSSAIMALSPSAAFVNALSGVGALSTKTAWIQLLVSHAVGWSSLALACWFTPRRWQDRPAKPSRNPVSTASRAARRQDNPERLAARAIALDRNPFTWLLSRDRWNAFMPSLIVLLGLALGAFVCLFTTDAHSTIIACFWVAFLSHVFIKANLGEQATQGLFQEKKSGALEYLLTTRLNPPTIIDGQWKSLKNQFARPILFLLAIDALFFAGTLLMAASDESGVGARTNEWTPLIAGWLYLFVALAADSFALGWAGMWEAIRSTKSWEKTRGNAFGFVCAMPTGAFILLWLGLLIVTDGRIGSVWLFGLGWFGFGMLGNFLCLKIFRPVVRGRFRKIVRESLLASKVR